MLNYLTDYNFNYDDINLIKQSLSNDDIQNLDIMKKNVVGNIKVLYKNNIKDITKLLIKRTDIFIKDDIYLEEKIKNQNLNFIKYIIENTPEDLVNFEI